MSRFQGDARRFFDSVYAHGAPWDVGGPQPALVQLFDDFPPESPVLDAGCGSGDLSIALAQRGLEVLGVDFVAAAITQAREKAASLPPAVAQRIGFEVADASRPDELGRRFRTVVDSGFLHVLDAAQTERYVASLARVVEPGGRFYLLEFATEFDVPNTPRRITEAELRSHFAESSGWRVLAVRAASFENRIAAVPAISACIERFPGE